MSRPTRERIEKIRAEHPKFRIGCSGCDLLAEIDELQAERDRMRVALEEWRIFARGYGLIETAAMEAALSPAPADCGESGKPVAAEPTP